MFSKGTDAIGKERHNHSVIQEGVSVKGEIQAAGDVRLDGKLEGKISATERVTVGATGALKADIEAGEVVVMGLVEGKIRANKRLELRKGARVIGDIATPVLVIEEGVHFHGSSHMESEDASSPSFGVLAGGKASDKKGEASEEPADALSPR